MYCYIRHWYLFIQEHCFTMFQYQCTHFPCTVHDIQQSKVIKHWIFCVWEILSSSMYILVNISTYWYIAEESSLGATCSASSRMRDLRRGWGWLRRRRRSGGGKCCEGRGGSPHLSACERGRAWEVDGRKVEGIGKLFTNELHISSYRLKKTKDKIKNQK